MSSDRMRRILLPKVTPVLASVRRQLLQDRRFACSVVSKKDKVNDKGSLGLLLSSEETGHARLPGRRNVC